jgi:thioesterase domain-containing protein
MKIDLNLRHAIERKLSSPADRSVGLVRLGGGEHEGSLCLVHSAAGGISLFQPLVERLGATRRIYGLVPDLHRCEEPDAAGLAALAAPRAAAVRPVAARGDLVLVGWSVTGLLAHAVAAQLEREGTPAARLVLLDSRVPDDVGDVVERLGSEQGQAALETGLGILAVGAPEGEMLAGARKLMLATLRAAMRYRPAPLSTPIVCIAAARSGIDEPTIAMWRDAAQGGFALHRLDCSHGDLLTTEQAAAVAAAIDSSNPDLDEGIQP